MKILPSAIVALLMFGFVTCDSAAENSVLARIGETEVQIEEVRSSIGNLDSREQAAVARDPALLNQAVRALLVQRAVLQEALAKQWDRQPEVAAQLTRVRENAIVESYLQSVSKTPESFPSDAEVQSAYDTNNAALLVPRQFRLAQIFIAAPEESGETRLGEGAGKARCCPQESRET